MSIDSLLAVSTVLLILLWVMMTFRHRLGKVIGRFPMASKILALIFVMALLALVLAPFLSLLFPSIQKSVP